MGGFYCNDIKEFTKLRNSNVESFFTNTCCFMMCSSQKKAKQFPKMVMMGSASLELEADVQTKRVSCYMLRLRLLWECLIQGSAAQFLIQVPANACAGRWPMTVQYLGPCCPWKRPGWCFSPGFILAKP